MKRFIVLSAMMLMLMTNNGCYFIYGNMKKMSNINVSEREFALNKLKNLPVYGNKTNGYKGIVANLEGYPINTIIEGGSERVTIALLPYQMKIWYLTPGTYTATSYRGGQKVGEWTFKVGAQVQDYMGNPVHWYTYFDL